jgi:prophage regulatory protein
MTTKAKGHQSASPDSQGYSSVHRMAERYDVGPATIWRWTKQGKLPKPKRISPGCSRWHNGEVSEAEADW